MKAQWKYYLLMAILVLLLSVELFLPKPVSWVKTLSSDDKIPYGTYILRNALSHKNPVRPNMTRASFYELADTLQSDILSISHSMGNGPDDLRSLTEHVAGGNTAIIAASQFGGEWDSIGVKTKDLMQETLVESANPITPDSSLVTFGSSEVVFMANDNVWVLDHDSTWQVLARHENGEPVVISRPFGRGRMFISSNPFLFTNYYLLRNTAVVDHLLTFLDPNFVWTELYSRGRSEPQTPIRYVLSQPALKWSYYVTIATLLLLVLFESKRKQRPIPILSIPKNESLEFAKTVGNLYYEKKDHRKVAEKMIAYLLEHIRSTYFLSTSLLDDDFYRLLSHKSGHPLINIEGLFTLISIIQSNDRMDEVQLLELNTKIESFIHGREQVRAAG